MFFKNSNPDVSHNHASLWVCSLNHPLTERCLNRKSRYPKGYRDFFYKNLKIAGELVYTVKGKDVSRNFNGSKKRVDTCLILW